MNTHLLIASSLCAMLLLSVSCNKSNTPDPEPEETYTVTVTNSFYFLSQVTGDSETCGKMLDVYKEKGFIEGHLGSYYDAVILEKTGVAASDTAKVYESLCAELSKKLKTSAEEIKKTDWLKIFDTDSFHYGLVDLIAVLPDGEKVEAYSLCAIPSISYNSEYTSADPNQPLQKFTVSEEGRIREYFKAKVTIKDMGEYDYTAKYDKDGGFVIGYPNESSPVRHAYRFFFDKPGDGKEMTLKYRFIDSKIDTVSVSYKVH